MRIPLKPWSLEIEAQSGSSLYSSLSANGFEFPCGGTGICGGCGVRILSGSVPVSIEDKAAFTVDEIASGWRLACRAHIEDPLVLECGRWKMDVLSDDTPLNGSGKHGLGVAIDLGTTTIAAQLIDLGSGHILAVRTALNPQVHSGADVMSRIRAVLAGVDLNHMVRTELQGMVGELAHGRAHDVREVLIVGNTVMHHIFCGLNIEPLASTPFDTPFLATQCFRPADLGWALPATCLIRFAPCIGGFVGGDIHAGIVACGMGEADELTALIDLGTNGEIAIGNREGIVCASTAAGPAFEAGCIRMGMRAVQGAISHVELVDGILRTSVIGDVEARGICGSGVVDAVAVGLDTGAILASGRVTNGTKTFPLSSRVSLCQSDIRQLQLAKAAIAAGFGLLLDRLGAKPQDLTRIHIAGAFGNYIRIESAVRIGLIEAPTSLIRAAGNTALRGAKALLLATTGPTLPPIEHVSLAAIPEFQDRFADCMTFPARRVRIGDSLAAQ